MGGWLGGRGQEEDGGLGTSGYSRAENEQDYLPQQGRARHYWRGEENEDDNASIKVVLKKSNK